MKYKVIKEFMPEEKWKDITSYEGLYQISNKGRVKSLINNIILKLYDDRYNTVFLSKGKKQKCYLVHRLVGKEFIENPLGKLEINHKDGNGLNNNEGNLEWCTRAENVRHTYRILGREKTNPTKGKFGKLHFRSKLIYQYDLIGNKIAEYWGGNEAKRKTGYTQSQIAKACREGNVVYGYKWKYIN